MIERWSWRGLAGALALTLSAGVEPSAFFPQTPPPRPAELPVTRLDGSAATPAPRQGPPGEPPAQLPGMPVTNLDDRARAADLDGPRTISLTLSQPLPLRDMLLLLVRGTPFSVVADEEVSGTFSGELKDLTMRQALEAVLFPRDLDYDLQGTLIRVFPRKPATRLFDINYLNVRRSVDRAIGGATAVAGGAPAVTSSSVTATDLLDELTKGVERLLSPTGRAHVDRAAGLVQVTDFSERLDEIGLYVEAVQLRATRQVRIDARVLEITFEDAAPLRDPQDRAEPGRGGTRFINWTEVVGKSPGAARRPSATTAGVRIGDFDAVMKTLAALGTVRVIAAPQLAAMNNEPAIMRVGTQAVHFVPAADGEGQVPATALQGLTLLVTAQIAADGIVQLHVAPSYAEKSGEARGPRGAAAPILDVQEADTLVRVRDGDTVIVAGFLKDRTRTTQGTGLAGFFGATAHQTVRSELVILLTPTIVAPATGAPSEPK